MEQKNSLARGTLIYAVGTFGTKILSFLIVPLYTYYITTSDMGVYDLIMSTISLLTPIVTMQISDAAYRWIIRDDIQDKEKYISTTIQVLIINCTIAIVIIFFVNKIMITPYCSYFCIILILSQMFQTMQKLLRGLKRQWLFAVSGIIYTTFFLSSNVIQLCIMRMGVKSLFQSTIIANIAGLIAVFTLEPQLRTNILHKIDKKLVFELYKYSMPLVPNYLNWWVINSSDRYIVLCALGNSFNGILAITHKFPSMLQAILALFNSSWQDYAVADINKDSSDYYIFVFERFYIFSFSCLLGLIPATKIIIMLVMSSDYKVACDYVAFYYLGTVFQSFASFYGVGYLRSGKTGKSFSTSVYGAIVNAIVNICSIKFIGLQAASISTFLGFLVMWLIRERQNRDELGISVKWVKFWGLTLMTITMSICSILTNVYCNIILFMIGSTVFLFTNKPVIRVVLRKIKSKMIKTI